jgi:3-oxoacyl-[acyl-carrier protein] reductase
MSNLRDLQGRVALVTGASRGLGRAIAISLGRRGASVAVNYWASPGLAEAVVADVEQAGGRAIALKGDVRNDEHVSEIVAKTNETLGHIDILVPNATGPQPFETIEQQTWRSYLDQLEFFVKSPLLLVQATLASMKSRRWGRIIQIGSEVVEVGHPTFANYVAAKGAQLAQTRSWARELAPWGITVNLVAPGWIPTERHAGTTQAELDTYSARVPMRRQGVPEDVGEAVAYLASEAARFITGQKLAVNGGHTLL